MQERWWFSVKQENLFTITLHAVSRDNIYIYNITRHYTNIQEVHKINLLDINLMETNNIDSYTYTYKWYKITYEH